MRSDEMVRILAKEARDGKTDLFVIGIGDGEKALSAIAFDL